MFLSRMVVRHFMEIPGSWVFSGYKVLIWSRKRFIEIDRFNSRHGRDSVGNKIGQTGADETGQAV